jgi:hypothetical protein
VNSIIIPLLRTLLIEFYRLNTGFFLLIGTLTFGFMSKVEHIALAQALTSSPYTLAIAAGVWLIYALKIVSFNSRQLNLQENLILFNFELLPMWRKITCAAVVFALQFLPAIGYGVFLISIVAAPPEHLFIIAGSMVACCAAGTVQLVRAFRLPFHERKTSSLQGFLNRRLYRPFAQFYLEGLMRTDPVMVAGTKLFSGALLYGVCALYRSVAYDNRLIAMALTACALANLLLLFRLHEFDHAVIRWSKNLPIAVTSRYLTLVLVILIFLLPECVVLFKYFPAQLSGYAALADALYLLGVNCFLLGLLQKKSGMLEDFTKSSFWIFIALVLLILFQTPAILLAGVTATAGYVLFTRNYYSFESPTDYARGA